MSRETKMQRIFHAKTQRRGKISRRDAEKQRRKGVKPCRAQRGIIHL